MSKILQENLRNLTWGKEDIKIEKFRTFYKSDLETQWKGKRNFVWDKNSELAVDVLAEVLLQSKKNQNCLGLTPTRYVLELS